MTYTVIEPPRSWAVLNTNSKVTAHRWAMGAYAACSWAQQGSMRRGGIFL